MRYAREKGFDKDDPCENSQHMFQLFLKFYHLFLNFSHLLFSFLRYGGEKGFDKDYISVDYLHFWQSKTANITIRPISQN